MYVLYNLNTVHCVSEVIALKPLVFLRWEDGWLLEEERDGVVSHGASVGRDVTLVAIRTAVQMVTAADSFSERTAAIFSTGQLATRLAICALG